MKADKNIGRRRGLNGEDLGEYRMRQDNTRMRNIGPTETPDLNEKQKDDLLTESTFDKVGEPYVSTIRSSPKNDNVRTTHADKAGFHHTYQHGTSDIKQDYQHPETGEKKTVKTGEVDVQPYYFQKEPKKGDYGYKAGKTVYANGKAVNKEDGTLQTNGFKHSIDLPEEERVKHKPTNNK